MAYEFTIVGTILASVYIYMALMKEVTSSSEEFMSVTYADSFGGFPSSRRLQYMTHQHINNFRETSMFIKLAYNDDWIPPEIDMNLRQNFPSDLRNRRAFLFVRDLVPFDKYAYHINNTGIKGTIQYPIDYDGRGPILYYGKFHAVNVNNVNRILPSDISGWLYARDGSLIMNGAIHCNSTCSFQMFITKDYMYRIDGDGNIVKSPTSSLPDTCIPEDEDCIRRIAALDRHDEL